MKEDQKEVLKAWIDGESIEYYNSSLNQWFDCSEFKDCDIVKFNNSDVYRIKPKISVSEINVFDGKFGVEINDLFKANLRLTFENGELHKAEVI